MKLIERAIALVVLTLLVTVSSAYAQTDRQTLVNIPFGFTVGEKAMPAGEYLIRRNRKDSDVVWVIQNKASGEAALLLTRSVHSADTQENAKFVFRKYDDFYFLSEFWAAGTNTGREIQVTDKERALSKSLAVAPQVHVLIDRGGR
ncbi:MAG TPA: hypothetical protein VJ749_17085 [Pyrinomonadaceae bacterium]|jgi:hypothetical protein|nr:hypothetical protein [Pyrinomonadaceae bacterium]